METAILYKHSQMGQFFAGIRNQEGYRNMIGRLFLEMRDNYARALLEEQMDGGIVQSPCHSGLIEKADLAKNKLQAILGMDPIFWLREHTLIIDGALFVWPEILK